VVPRRRRLIAVLGVLALLVAAAAVAAYTTLRPPGDVSDPQVQFEAPTQTPAPDSPPKAERVDRFQWRHYGYTKDHHRAYHPPKPLRGPWRRMWKRKAPALLEFPPVISGDTLYQLADNGLLVAIAKETGKRRWRRKLGTLAASSPAIVDGTLYVTLLETGPGAGRKRGRIVALRARDGKIRWSHRLPSRSESSPLVHRGRVYFGSEDGTVYALKTAGGRVVWTYRAAGAVKGSPTLADGKLYFGDYGGHVQAVRVSDGKRVWDNDDARAPLRGGEYYATAAAAFGRVYIGSTDGRMYSFSSRDGRLAWARQTEGYVYSSAAVDNVPGVGPTIFFGSYDGHFYAADARSGRIRWRHKSGGKISGSPTIIGDTVYFADLGRSRTIGLRTRNGAVEFRQPQGGYDPVVSDGRYLFLTGRYSLSAFLPARVARREAARKRSERAERRAGQRDDAASGDGR
jgi:outer membrane protein assembly factor BamB